MSALWAPIINRRSAFANAWRLEDISNEKNEANAVCFNVGSHVWFVKGVGTTFRRPYAYRDQPPLGVRIGAIRVIPIWQPIPIRPDDNQLWFFSVPPIHPGRADAELAVLGASVDDPFLRVVQEILPTGDPIQKPGDSTKSLFTCRFKLERRRMVTTIPRDINISTAGIRPMVRRASGTWPRRRGQRT